MRLTFYRLPALAVAMILAVGGGRVFGQHAQAHAGAPHELGSGRQAWIIEGASQEASIYAAGADQVTLVLPDGSVKALKRNGLRQEEDQRVSHWLQSNQPPKDFGEPDQVIRLKAIQGEMRYDQDEIRVRPGSKIQLILQNLDDMHHNLLLCTEDSGLGMEVAQAAWALGGQGFAKEWVPVHPKVLFASRMVNPHSTVHGYFTAPETEGNFPYVCTLPGHAAFMKGVLKVRPRPSFFSELTYMLYHGGFTKLPDFDTLEAVATDHVASGLIDLKVSDRKDRFAVVFDAFLNVPETGSYRFSLASDDGSRLEIDGEVVIDSDGLHAPKLERKRLQLEKGKRRFRLAYFENTGDQVLYIGWSGPGFEEKPLCVWPPKGRDVVPSGIPLSPQNGEARLYRNFIEGAGNRAIGVGYPGGINAAFDADQMRLAIVWLGKFIDAARHWVGRGPGRQPPAGYGVVHGPPGAPFARLDSAESSWPEPEGRSSGYQFKGYRLTGAQRLPVFLYRFGDIEISDVITPQGTAADGSAALMREITLKGPENEERLYYRAALADDIQALDDGRFLINASLLMDLKSPSGARAILRDQGEQRELLYPVAFADGVAGFSQHLSYLLGNH